MTILYRFFGIVGAKPWRDAASCSFHLPKAFAIRSDDDQIVPIGASAMLSSKLITNAQLKIYKGAPHGICATHKDQVDENLLLFITN